MSVTASEIFCREYKEGLNLFDAAIAAGFNLYQSPLGLPYVYCLARLDTSEIIYIGKGRKKRMFSHIDDVKSGRVRGLKKYKGIKKLLDRGIALTPYVLFYKETDADALSAESFLINQIGCDYLLNSSPGIRNESERALVDIDLMLGKIMPKDKWLKKMQTNPFYADRPEGLKSPECYDKNMSQILSLRAEIVSNLNAQA